MSDRSTDKQLASTIAMQLDIEQNQAKDGTVIFLKGPWGSGKTYFWKNTIRPNLKTKKCIYVSLFGVQSVNDLKHKLLASILAGEHTDSLPNKGRNLIARLAPSLVNFFENWSGFKFDCDLFELISSKMPFVICFDDFERLPKECSVEEILGFINYLSEHKAFRNLIIMNESEIKPEHKEAFNQLREKLSLRTFQLELDMTGRFKTFLESMCTTNSLSMNPTEEDEILRAIVKLKTDNLRTVRFILDCYFQLRVNLQQELPKEVIQFLAAMIDHESKGNAKDESFYSFNPMEIYFREHSRKDDRNKDKKLDQDPQTKFYFNYFGENAPYRIYRCVYEVVKNGHFSIDAARNELFPVEAELTKAQRLARQIRDTHFFFSQDDELESLIEEITDLIKTSDSIDFASLTLLAKGLSSATRLLERDEVTALPDKFEILTVEAVKALENPGEVSRDIGHRSNDLAVVFVDTFQRVCKNEDKNRKLTSLNEAVKIGTVRDLKEQLLESTLVLEQIYTSGQIKSIWDGALQNEEKYGLLETLVKAMARNSGHNATIKAELEATHQFLTDQYSKVSSKMHRLRLYRIIEATSLEVPSERPKIVDKR